MSTTTGWVIGLIVLILGGVGAYWAYSASQPHDAMMHEDAMTNSGDTMMHDATTSDSMVHANVMASSSDSMMQH